MNKKKVIKELNDLADQLFHRSCTLKKLRVDPDYQDMVNHFAKKHHETLADFRSYVKELKKIDLRGVSKHHKEKIAVTVEQAKERYTQITIAYMDFFEELLSLGLISYDVFLMQEGLGLPNPHNKGEPD